MNPETVNPEGWNREGSKTAGTPPGTDRAARRVPKDGMPFSRQREINRIGHVAAFTVE
jgi:hypothetical protein